MNTKERPIGACRHISSFYGKHRSADVYQDLKTYDFIVIAQYADNIKGSLTATFGHLVDAENYAEDWVLEG